MPRRVLSLSLAGAMLVFPACHDGPRATLVDAGPVGDAGPTTLGALSLEPIPGSDPLARVFAKRVRVFGVELVATAAVPNLKLLHAATVLAEYVDNDEDGDADDPAVLAALADNRALLVMFANAAELERTDVGRLPLDGRVVQDLQGDETLRVGGFDATLEEVLHLVQNAGYSPVYADLRTVSGSRLSNAMDLARGGVFNRVPARYPPSAWYHYDDTTCDYECQASEYFYWGLTTRLGAQSERCGEIAHEWEPCTPALLGATDAALEALLADPTYGLPVNLPDGTYR